MNIMYIGGVWQRTMQGVGGNETFCIVYVHFSLKIIKNIKKDFFFCQNFLEFLETVFIN